MPERSILDQLGVNLPPPPAGGIADHMAQPPMAEMGKPTELGGVEALADTMIVGALMLLTQAFPMYGSASEKGDSIIKAISSLKKIVPPERVKEAEANITSLLSGMGKPPMGVPGPAPMPGPAVPPAPGGAVGAPPSPSI